MVIIVRWCLAMGWFFLLIQTRSPNTALELQFFVEFGGLKALGLTKVQITKSEIGMSANQSSQTLLHIAIASTIIMGIRVQALQGFEWRIQLVSSNLKVRASFSEKDMIHGFIKDKYFRVVEE